MEKQFSDFWFIGVGLLVLFIFLIIFLMNKRNKEHKKKLNAFQVRYNQIKSIPLPFKIDKAYSIALTDEEIMSTVKDYQKKYEEIDVNFKDINSNFEIVEDAISFKKYKNLDTIFNEIDSKLKINEASVKEMNTFLDSILERESLERGKANNLKEKFQILKQKFYQNANVLGPSAKNIENKLGDCEDLFSDFEDHIYASKFVQAKQDLKLIEENIVSQEKLLNDIPPLLELAEGAIPVLREEIKRQYTLTKQRGVYLNHLKVEEKLNEINVRLEEYKNDIAVGKIENTQSNLNEVVEDLRKLLKGFSVENKALHDLKDSFSCIEEILNIVDGYYENAFNNNSYVKTAVTSEDLENLKEEQKNIFEPYKNKYNELKEASLGNCIAPSQLVKEATGLLTELEDARKTLKTKLHTIIKMMEDEENARLQLAKFQLLLFEMKAKIAIYKLPSISEMHKEDMNKCFEYTDKIKKALASQPLEIGFLNQLVEDSMRFIYDIYRKINNIVQMANMVENVIVFGNKYRSSYPEIDSELIRSELTFHNGEYYHALTIAIACIEKIFPNSLSGDMIVKK